MRDAISLAAAIEVAPYSQFEQLQRLVWHCLAIGAISEDDAQSLDALIRKRRGDGAQRPVGATVGAAYAKRRGPKRRVSKDRAAAIIHRRGLAGSGAFPWQIAARFPTGQQAVLTIIGREVQAHGDCRVTIQELADRAKVSRSTVQNTIQEARSLGLISVEARRLSPVKNPGQYRAHRLRGVAHMAQARPRGTWMGCKCKKVEPSDTKIKTTKSAKRSNGHSRGVCDTASDA
jgi:hypothetical protein